MKRLFALLLVVAMLLSLCVLPISAAEQSKMSVASFTTFTVDEDGYVVYGAPKTTPYEKDDLVAVKATFHNAEAETIKLMSIEMVMEYDSSVLEPYTWEYEGDTYGIAVFADSFKMEAAANVIAEGKAKISGASGRGVNVTAGATIDVAYYLFKVKNDIESGDAAFTLKIDELTKKGAVAGEADDIKDSVAIEENTMPVSGKAPTIGSTSVDKSEVAYGSDEVLTLGATSTSNKDITSFVTFKVQDAQSNDVSSNFGIDGNKLTVKNADAGTYTVIAEPNGSDCVIDGNVTIQNATFKITEQKITNPVATITNFVKGEKAFDLGVDTTTPGLRVGYSCYDPDGNRLGSTDKFKADTIYTIEIGLEAYENYVIDTTQKLTYTINGGESLTADILEGIPVNGVTTYKAVVIATTAGLDTPRVDSTPTPSSARWKMTLKDVTLSGGRVVFDGENGTVEVPGTFAWMDPTKDVGEPTVYPGSTNVYRRFYAKFVPTDTETYAVIENIPIFVDVHKISLYITSIDSWDYNAENPFQYNGESHKVQLEIPTDLKDLVTVTYEENEKTAAGNYTAKATIEEADPTHYLIEPSNSPERTLSWQIKKGTLTGYKPTYTKEVTFGAAQEFDITPDLFGLPAYDVEHFNVQDPSSTIESDPLLTNRTILPNGGINYELRATTIADVNNNVTSERTLTYLYDNYEAFTVKLIIKVIAKTTNSDTLKITVPNEVTYGTTVNPSVGDTKPADAGEVTFKFFDKDGKQVTDQPFPVGEYKVTAICEDSSTIYTAEESFEVVPYELKDENVTLGSDLAYTGIEQTQTVTVTVGGKPLTVDTDYTVTGLTGTEPGTYTVTVTGTGNYIGTVTKAFKIEKADIASANISDIEGPFGYTGIAWEPTVTVKFNNADLKLGTDYTVSYKDNVNVGTATVTITGTGDHFKGTATKTFVITAASINGSTVSTVAIVTYNTKAQTPAVTVASSGRILTADDYEVAYTNNVNAGTATVTVTGKGNFTGTASKNFTIAQAYLSVENQTVTHFRTETGAKTYPVPADMFLADEKETGFTITVTDYAGDAIFTTAPAVDGTNVNYQLNGTVGTAVVEVKVKPDSSNYADASFTLTFVVNDKENVSGSISFPDGSAVYTGTGIKYENATISGYSGTLRYGYTPNASTGASLDASGLPLTVGTYTVAVTFNSDASFGYKTATFTITKATPTGTPGYTKLESSGKTLADAKLTVGTIRPAGTIAWDLLLTTVLEDGKAYAWTFTPNDTHNYTILTGTLIPYVDDGMDYIPGVIGGNTGSFNFHDVSRLDYFYDAVKWAAENGIASGTGRYTFSPNAVCTRAQTVTFLWRAAGSPLPRYRVCPFTDVQPSDYYYNAVLWAVEQGITTGLNATTFGPDVTVTRGQVATFLYRAASAAKPNTFNPFADVKTTAYNYNAILWAYDNRITTGTSDTTFSPDAYCTRAQIVTFLYRYYQGR